MGWEVPHPSVLSSQTLVLRLLITFNFCLLDVLCNSSLRSISSFTAAYEMKISTNKLCLKVVCCSSCKHTLITQIKNTKRISQYLNSNTTVSINPMWNTGSASSIIPKCPFENKDDFLQWDGRPEHSFQFPLQVSQKLSLWTGPILRSKSPPLFGFFCSSCSQRSLSQLLDVYKLQTNGKSTSGIYFHHCNSFLKHAQWRKWQPR